MITRPSYLRLELPERQIAALCERYDVAELAVFGTALREDFRPGSDVDFLVVFKNDHDYGPWMSRLTGFQSELSKVLGRPVDVVSRAGVEQSENYIRRRHILKSAQTVYVAR